MKNALLLDSIRMDLSSHIATLHKICLNAVEISERSHDY